MLTRVPTADASIPSRSLILAGLQRADALHRTAGKGCLSDKIDRGLGRKLKTICPTGAARETKLTAPGASMMYAACPLQQGKVSAVGVIAAS